MTLRSTPCVWLLQGPLLNQPSFRYPQTHSFMPLSHQMVYEGMTEHHVKIDGKFVLESESGEVLWECEAQDIGREWELELGDAFAFDMLGKTPATLRFEGKQAKVYKAGGDNAA